MRNVNGKLSTDVQIIMQKYVSTQLLVPIAPWSFFFLLISPKEKELREH